MIQFTRILTGLLFSVVVAAADFWGYAGDREEFLGKVWEAPLEDFDRFSYGRALSALLADFERRTGRALEPGSDGRVGIKLYTNSGTGLATSRNLVRALVEALEARGYARGDLFLYDVSESGLRANGYLPPLSRMEEVGFRFEGVPVHVLDHGDHFDADWYYENPLPMRHTYSLLSAFDGESLVGTDSGDRRSFLPAHVVREVDFWINLPVVTDHRTLGINGVLANATLWSVSNRDRFFVSASNAPIAIAEIAAIPELLSAWSMSIVSLEQYQYIGGPRFRSYYTRSEPRIWMGVDPVILDALVLERINEHRRDHEFQPLDRDQPVFEYAHSLGVGYYDTEKVEWFHPEPVDE